MWGQRTTFRRRFSPSTLQVLGMESGMWSRPGTFCILFYCSINTEQKLYPLNAAPFHWLVFWYELDSLHASPDGKLAESTSHNHEDLGLMPNTQLGVLACAYNPTTGGIQAPGAWRPASLAQSVSPAFHETPRPRFHIHLHTAAHMYTHISTCTHYLTSEARSACIYACDLNAREEETGSLQV